MSIGFMWPFNLKKSVSLSNLRVKGPSLSRYPTHSSSPLLPVTPWHTQCVGVGLHVPPDSRYMEWIVCERLLLSAARHKTKHTPAGSKYIFRFIERGDSCIRLASPLKVWVHLGTLLYETREGLMVPVRWSLELDSRGKWDCVESWI